VYRLCQRKPTDEVQRNYENAFKKRGGKTVYKFDDGASGDMYLVGKGVDGERLVTMGWGDKKPVADNRTEEGRAKNRRVELVKK